METTYTVVQLDSTLSERYAESDSKLVNSFEVNSAFNPTEHYIQAFFYIEDEILSSNLNYLSYRIHSDSEIAGKGQASRIVIDPIEDVKALNYRVPQVRTVYNFYNSLFSSSPKARPKFYIDQISEDGLELLLITTDLNTDQIVQTVVDIQNRLLSDQNFLDFTLLFQDSIEVVAVAVSTLDYKNTKAVVVKLYQELPGTLAVKSELEVVEIISDSANFLVDSLVIEDVVEVKRLSDPNFDLEDLNETSLPTPYLNYNELLSIDTSYNSNIAELLSKTSEKSIEINVDYSQFSNFINYSSASERLVNFKYKLTLIESYQNSLDQLSSTPSATVSKRKFEDLIEGIVRNLDHYERYLYFEKSDYSWPKTGVNKPYTLLATTDITAQSWYNAILAQANTFDSSNYSSLVNTVPAYIREDSQNDPYTLFINMIGHHFDNLWIYTKAVTSKYDADNRINSGVSKDLVEEVLKNFGIKLYSSTKSVEDLFRYFTLDTYDTQSEDINSNITVQSLQTSQKDYQKEVYKRLYHNLPLLLKSKGTERAVRVLITSFGIPAELLPVKLYGGVDRSQTPYLAQQTVQSGSYDKIRIPSASLGVDSIVSYYADTLEIETEYTADLHRIEVGYSPTDNIDNYILSQLASQFNIDNYLGDPRGIDYSGLKTVSKTILQTLDRYDLKDFVRLIKFFDNRLFKMVKDFLPARAVVDTGIIIKPHLLERSKGVLISSQTSGDESLTGSIDTAFIEGADGSTFGSKSDYVTSYTSSFQTPEGIVNRPASPNGIDLIARTDGETPRYTGEFSGSVLEVSDGELNRANPFKRLEREATSYNLTLKSDGTCLLAGNLDVVYLRNRGPFDITVPPFFTNTTPQPYTAYTGKSGATISTPKLFTLDPAVYLQGNTFNITADRGGACIATTPTEIAYCMLNLATVIPNDISVNGNYNLTQWFSPDSAHSGATFEYVITTSDSQTFTLNSAAAANYVFTGTTYTVTSTPVTVKQKIPALNNKPTGTECSISVTLGITFGCTLTLTSLGQSTRRSINEGTSMTSDFVLQSFGGAVDSFTTYDYQTTVIAGGDGDELTGLLGTHPTITPLTVPSADCLYISASNGAGCQAVARVGINRQANRASVDARETFIGYVNDSPIVNIIATYYNPSGVPTQAALIPNTKPIIDFDIHPTLTFTTPAAIDGRRVWFEYYNSSNESVSEAIPPIGDFPFITRPTESILPEIVYATSACT